MVSFMQSSEIAKTNQGQKKSGQWLTVEVGAGGDWRGWDAGDILGVMAVYCIMMRYGLHKCMQLLKLIEPYT